MPNTRLLALWTVGLLLVACDEDELPNQPPTLDWALTVPADDSLPFQRREQESLSFGISDAVEDPDGDTLSTIWYWVDSEGSPHFLFGTLTMKFDQPCDFELFSSAQSGSFISVVAVVSDHVLTWVPAVDKTQPVQTALDADGTPFPLIKRVWMVELLDTCL